MALQKTFVLPNGTSGNYIRAGEYQNDPIGKRLSAHLMLYLSAAQRAAAPDAHICLVAKLRLEGAAYTTWIHADGVIAEQIYTAAKVEPLLAGGGLFEISLADAVDV